MGWFSSREVQRAERVRLTLQNGVIGFRRAAAESEALERACLQEVAALIRAGKLASAEDMRQQGRAARQSANGGYMATKALEIALDHVTTKEDAIEVIQGMAARFGGIAQVAADDHRDAVTAEESEHNDDTCRSAAGACELLIMVLKEIKKF